MSNVISIKKEGEIITLKPDKVGSIQHTFRILEGRATLIESPHNNTLKNGLSLTVAATIEEVEQLVDVLGILKDIMLTQLSDKAIEENKCKEEPELGPGTLVETCDKRYGIVKKVDWHALKFIRRKDYQIQFPDGVGIFRRDELKLVEITNK